MKYIKKPKLTVKADQGADATVDLLLLNCLKNMPQGGFDFATMRARARIADAIEKCAALDQIALEDADFAIAVAAVRDMRWGTAHPDILIFAELFGL